MSRLGVVAALPAEARALGVGRHAPGDTLFTLENGSLLAVSGIGLPAAAAAAQRLADAGCGALLTFGLAGGLDPTLAAGALLLPQAVRSPDGIRYLTADDWRGRWAMRLQPLGRVAQGDLLTCAQPLARSADKAQAHAACGAVGVDMESAAVAGLAAARGLPYLCLRVVVDTAADELPRAVAAASAGGALKIGRLVGGLVRRPADLVPLLQLAARYRTALRALHAVGRLGLISP